MYKIIMIPGICPTTGNRCEHYNALCVGVSDRIGRYRVEDVVLTVNRLASEYPCGEIGVDEDGPIEPFCAALGAAVLLTMAD